MGTGTNLLEKTLLSWSVALTAATLVLALGWPEVWEPMSKEDTGPEAITVLALGLLGCIAIRRASQAPSRARGPLILLAMLALFAAGEEVSWGQRLLAFEAPEFFAEHNVQAETNLHNLIPPPFDFLLGLLVLVTFAVAPAIVTRAWPQALIRRGLPWPRWPHVYVLFGCALPAGALAATGIDGLEELVELIAVLVAAAVVSAKNVRAPSEESATKDLGPQPL